MNELGDTSYDKVPYFSQAYAQSHPDRLAAMAKLFGMTPAPLGECRVLELGCASGGNLIPMAVHLPGSSFVGFDLSVRQIADGKAIVEQLQLRNIELRQMDILAVDQTIGKFDYIIAHGVYSWVPAEVQDKLLAICGENLTPNGVAYVSYNTYPVGACAEWSATDDLHHSKQFAMTSRCNRRGRCLIWQNVPVENNPLGILLSSRWNRCYLWDFTLPMNIWRQRARYFHQFAQQRLPTACSTGEAEFHTMLAPISGAGHRDTA
jgi:SAM-dependent methyltransferase